MGKSETNIPTKKVTVGYDMGNSLKFQSTPLAQVILTDYFFMNMTWTKGVNWTLV